MIVTKEWIENHRTGAGGWTKLQIVALGLPWPPRSGWKKLAVGREISDKARAIFESERTTNADKKAAKSLSRAKKKAARQLAKANRIARSTYPKPSATAVEHRKLPKEERDAFFRTRQWRELRYEALKIHGAKCQCCGATAKSSGAPLHVDHIKPRWHYPELALKLSNLQILCEDCNIGKGAHDQTDWRPAPDTPSELDDEYRRRLQ